MPLFLACWSPHNDSDRPSDRLILEAENEFEATVKAVHEALQLYGPCDDREADAALPAVREAIKLAKEQGEAPILVPDFHDPDEPYRFAFWNRGPSNCGFGPSCDGTVNGTDRSDNRWFEIKPWTPRPERVAELRAMTHEELVMRVLELEATR